MRKLFKRCEHLWQPIKNNYALINMIKCKKEKNIGDNIEYTSSRNFRKYINKKSREIVEAEYRRHLSLIFNSPEANFEEMMCLKNDDSEAFTICYSLKDFNEKFEELLNG